MSEFAWLIESENGFYIGVLNYRKRANIGWTANHNNALRFARKEDAEAMIKVFPNLGLALHENAKGAVEHGWDYFQSDIPAKMQEYPEPFSGCDCGNCDTKTDIGD